MKKKSTKLLIASSLALLSVLTVSCTTKKTVNTTTESTLSSAQKIMNEFSRSREQSDKEKKNEVNQIQNSSEAPIENKAYGLNEEAIIGTDTNQPYYSLKIIKATTNLSNSDDLYTDGKPENTIELTYEYKNYNVNEPMQVRSQFINGYDKSGLAGKTLSMASGKTDVPKDKSAQTTTWIVMEKPMLQESDVEIAYTNDFSLGFKDTLSFKVPLEH